MVPLLKAKVHTPNHDARHTCTQVAVPLHVVCRRATALEKSLCSHAYARIQHQFIPGLSHHNNAAHHNSNMKRVC